MRPGKLDQITRDHTIVAMLVASGAIAAEAADTHPERHLLTQAIGTRPDITPDVAAARIPKGARILLSTDGLHDLVPADEILGIAAHGDLERAAHDLVQCANDRGGPDNITVVLVAP